MKIIIKVPPDPQGTLVTNNNININVNNDIVSSDDVQGQQPIIPDQGQKTITMPRPGSFVALPGPAGTVAILANSKGSNIDASKTSNIAVLTPPGQAKIKVSKGFFFFIFSIKK